MAKRAPPPASGRNRACENLRVDYRGRLEQCFQQLWVGEEQPSIRPSPFIPP